MSDVVFLSVTLGLFLAAFGLTAMCRALGAK